MIPLQDPTWRLSWFSPHQFLLVVIWHVNCYHHPTPSPLVLWPYFPMLNTSCNLLELFIALALEPNNCSNTGLELATLLDDSRVRTTTTERVNWTLVLFPWAHQFHLQGPFWAMLVAPRAPVPACNRDMITHIAHWIRLWSGQWKGKWEVHCITYTSHRILLSSLDGSTDIWSYRIREPWIESWLIWSGVGEYLGSPGSFVVGSWSSLTIPIF